MRPLLFEVTAEATFSNGDVVFRVKHGFMTKDVAFSLDEVRAAPDAVIEAVHRSFALEVGKVVSHEAVARLVRGYA